MFDDLRSLLDALDGMGKLRKVEGADWNLEMGTLLEAMMERYRANGPTLLFDNIKDYPEGFRVVTYPLYSREAQKLCFDIPEGLSDLEILKWWKEKWANLKPGQILEVESGPVQENIITGDDIDILKFPIPKWHELDGGRYIGTGIGTITQDPDEGWYNVGTYRVMVHDAKTLSFYVSPGKHADIMRQKYWDRGESCPVVMVVGPEPLLYVASSTLLPWGQSELDLVSCLKGKPFEYVKGRKTGLPIPATSEIVIEGFAPPPSVESRSEGPFGEWTGYYASGSRNDVIVKIETIYHRNNPILWGQPPLKPPIHTGGYPIPIQLAASLWDALEKNGMQGIKGVWVHGPGERVIGVVSIQQQFLGHAKQVATMLAGLLQGGACVGRYIIVVDDDIDVADWQDITWAICTRCDPEVSIDLVRGYLTSPLDPMIPPEKRAVGDYTAAKVIINACRPYHWRKQFPPVNKASDELKSKVVEKWSNLLNP